MSAIKSSDEIYPIIENALTGATSPVTCADLMDRPEVRAAAMRRFGNDIQIATNKLSDLLGFMWRKGVVDRFSASSSRTMARYAYLLRQVDLSKQDAEPKPIPSPVVSGSTIADLTITESNGEITLDFKQFVVKIRPK
jgi:hypothetical protein